MELGTTLAHYEIVRRLGGGGMGDVYVGRDTKLDRTVAIKVLPAALAASPEYMLRFEREAQAIASLDHPNIVAVHSIEKVEQEDSTVHFITMQLVEGKVLSELIPAGGLALDRFLDVSVQLTDGVCAAHEQGITHRDLKPANVIVTTNGRVKVLDFGLAKLAEPEPIVSGETQAATLAPPADLTEAGTIIGTVSYMSPEQADGKDLDQRTDVFSLGIMLYEMATGRSPFTGESKISLLSSIMKDEPVPVTEVRAELPRQLGRIIKHALEKDPDQRFQSAKDLRNELAGLQTELQSEEILASASGRRHTESASPARRSLAPLLAGVAVVVLGALAFDIGGVRDSIFGPTETAAVLAARPTLAVLPFENESSDADNEYFALGLTTELVSKLSQMQSLDVRHTPFGWVREAGSSATQLGDELGVGFLLDGRARRAGDDIRISVFLIETASGDHVWAQDFDGSLDDMVFDFQEEIAFEVAASLDIRLTVTEELALRHRETSNSEAADATTRGWVLLEQIHLRTTTPSELVHAAHADFERALVLDPDYVRAIAGLSVVQSVYVVTGVDAVPARLRRAEELADEALTLDPESADAHFAMANVHVAAGDFERAIGEYERALAIDPDNAIAWCELAYSCMFKDPAEPEPARQAAQRSIALRPGYFYSYYWLGEALYALGRYPEARREFEVAKRLVPGHRDTDVMLGRTQLIAGDADAARAGFEAALRVLVTPGVLTDLAATQAVLGDADAAIETLRQAGQMDDFVGWSEVDAPEHLEALRQDAAVQEFLNQRRR